MFLYLHGNQCLCNQRMFLLVKDPSKDVQFSETFERLQMLLGYLCWMGLIALTRMQMQVRFACNDSSPQLQNLISNVYLVILLFHV